MSSNLEEKLKPPEVQMDMIKKSFRSRQQKKRTKKSNRPREDSQQKSVEHIVLHRHFEPSSFGPFSKHSCSDMKRFPTSRETGQIASIIITDSQGVPDWGPPWRKFRNSLVNYNTNHPRLINRVDRLRRRVEKGKCLSGGPVYWDADGSVKVISRRLSKSSSKLNIQFYLDICSAFSPSPAYVLVDKKRSPDKNKMSLWDRFGRDPSVVAVPLKKETDSPFWRMYLQVFQSESVRERKRRCENLIRRLQEEKSPNRRDYCFPSLQMEKREWQRVSKLMLPVLGKSAPIPGRRKRRPAFQSPRTLVEALAAAVFGCHPKRIRLLVPPID
jgi:hypothetical protein